MALNFRMPREPAGAGSRDSKSWKRVVTTPIRIPVVDDDADLVRVTCGALAQAGYAACAATSGALVPAPDVPLDRGRTTAVLRIVQESLTNVLRHARATRVEIVLRPEGPA